MQHQQHSLSAQFVQLLPHDIRRHIIDSYYYFPLNRYFRRYYRDLIRKLENCTSSAVKLPFRKTQQHYTTKSSIDKYLRRIWLRIMFGYFADIPQYQQRMPFLVWRSVDFSRFNFYFYWKTKSDLDESSILSILCYHHVHLLRTSGLLRVNVAGWHHGSSLFSVVSDASLNCKDGVIPDPNPLRQLIDWPCITSVEFRGFNVGSIPLAHLLMTNQAHARPGLRSLIITNGASRATLPVEIVYNLCELHGHSLYKLDISEYKLTKEGLMLVTAYCRYIEELTIAADSVTNAIVAEAFSQHDSYPYLRILRIRFIYNDDANEHLLFKTILRRCPRLENLFVLNSFISDRSIDMMAKYGSLSNISVIMSPSTLDASLPSLAVMQGLKRIEFSSCIEFNDEYALSIARSLTQLEELTLSFTSMTDAGIIHLLRCLYRLKELRVTLSEYVTGRQLFSSETHLHCPNLKRLYLNHNWSLCYLGEDGKLASSFPSLEKVVLYGSSIGDNAIYYLALLPFLKMIDISFCSYITARSIKWLKRMQNLEQLFFSYSPFSPPYWSKLVRALPNLTHLDASVGVYEASTSPNRRRKKKKKPLSVYKLQKELDGNDQIVQLRFRSHH